MTVLRARALDAQGNPVVGRTAVLEAWTGNRYQSPYNGPRAVRGIPAVSASDGWMQWTLPALQRRPGPKGTLWVITGLEAAPVVVATQPGDTTTTGVRVGTISLTDGSFVPTPSVPVDTGAEAAAAAQAAVSAVTSGAPASLDTLAEIAAVLNGRLADTALKDAFVQPLDGWKHGGIVLRHKLRTNQDCVWAHLGDSTANGDDEWLHLALAQFATDYPNMKVTRELWNDTTQALDPPVVVQAGNGGPDPAPVVSDTFTRTGNITGSAADTGQTWATFGGTGATLDGAQATLPASTGVYSYITHGLDPFSAGGVVAKARFTIPATINNGVAFRLSVFGTSGQYELMAGVTAASGGLNVLLYQRTGGAATQVGAQSPFLTMADTADRVVDLTVTLQGSTFSASIAPAAGGTSVSASGTIPHPETTWTGWATKNLSITSAINAKVDSTSIGPGSSAAPATLRVLNGSMPGASTTYFTPARIATIIPVAPDLLTVSTSHNHGTQDVPTYLAAVDAMVAQVLARFPGTGVALSSQNPQKSPNAAAQVAAHLVRIMAIRPHARAKGWGYIAAAERFLTRADRGQSWVIADGTHPDPATGFPAWRDAALAYLRGADEPPAVPATPAQLAADPTLKAAFVPRTDTPNSSVLLGARGRVGLGPAIRSAARIGSAGHGWSIAGGVDDATVKMLGELSYKVTTGGTGVTITLNGPVFTTPQDWSKSIPRFLFRIDDLTKVNFWTISIVTGAGNVFTSGGGLASYVTAISNEWAVLTLPRGFFTVSTGTPAWTGVTQVQINLKDKAAGGFTFWTHGVDLLPDLAATYPNGVLILEADDGYASQKTMLLPLAEGLGVPVTLPLIIERVTSGQAGMTVADLKAFERSGHQLASHAYSSAFHGTAGASAATAEADFTAQQRWYDDNGLDGSMDYACCPGTGSVIAEGSALMDVVRRRFRSVRNNAGYYETAVPPDPHRFRSLLYAGDTAVLTTHINRMTTPGGVFLLAMHEIIAGSTDGTASGLTAPAYANLKTALQLAASNGMAFRTRADLLAGR